MISDFVFLSEFTLIVTTKTPCALFRHQYVHYAASGEIQIHPSGTTLYVSNRGFVNEKDNTIVIYPIMPTTGKLVSTNVKWVATGGKTPRDFALDETGRWLLVGNQDSDTLAVFELVEELIEAEEEGNTALVAVKVCKQPPTLYPCKTPACITFAK